MSASSFFQQRSLCKKSHAGQWERGMIADGWGRKHTNAKYLGHGLVENPSDLLLSVLMQESACHSQEPRSETHATSNHASTFDGKKPVVVI